MARGVNDSPALDNSARGRRNRTHGKRVAAAILAELVKTWPHAEHTSGINRGDFTGIGDWSLEATDADWDQLGPKATQAARDAVAQGYTRWAVVKPRRARAGSPARPAREWWAISELGQVIEREARIAQLEHTVAEYQRLVRSALAGTDNALELVADMRRDRERAIEELLGGQSAD